MSEKDLYLKAMSQHIMKTKITLLDDVTCELLLKAGAPREFVDIMYPPEAESHPVYMLTNENMLLEQMKFSIRKIYGNFQINSIQIFILFRHLYMNASCYPTIVPFMM